MNFIGAGEASKWSLLFLTENALLDMFGHRGFQTFPIVLAPQKSIGSRYSIMT